MTHQQHPSQAWLSDKDLAARFGVSRITIWRWAREREGFPRPKKIGPHTARWSLAAIEQFERSVDGEAGGDR